MPWNELHMRATVGKDDLRFGQRRESSTVVRTFLLAVLSASSIESVCIGPGVIGRFMVAVKALCVSDPDWERSVSA